MRTAQFFSNTTNNALSKLPQDTDITYYWNGTKISWSGTSWTNTPADPSLTLQTIYDTGINTGYNFSIMVIDDCTLPSNKFYFNQTYKNALTSYINSPDCSATARTWLTNIINRINVNI
jgi:hypothetical protein